MPELPEELRRRKDHVSPPVGARGAGAVTPAAATALPENYETVLCTHWVEKRGCPFRPKCMYAHGEEDLRRRV
jgi:hypothetical protein